MSGLEEGAVGSSWRVNAMKTESQGRKSEPNHRCHKRSPRKRRNDGMPAGHSGEVALRREKCSI
jgi:hypothetical protein